MGIESTSKVIDETSEIMQTEESLSEEVINGNSKSSGKLETDHEMTNVEQIVKNKKPATIEVDREHYNSMKRKLRYARTQLSIFKIKFKTAKMITKSPLFDHIMKNLSSDQINFLQLLLKNNGVKGRGRKYSFSEKSLALLWYKQSPKSYNFVSTIFPLPTHPILCSHSAQILFEAGLSSNLLKFIKSVVSKMPEKDRLFDYS